MPARLDKSCQAVTADASQLGIWVADLRKEKVAAVRKGLKGGLEPAIRCQVALLGRRPPVSCHI